MHLVHRVENLCGRDSISGAVKKYVLAVVVDKVKLNAAFTQDTPHVGAVQIERGPSPSQNDG